MDLAACVPHNKVGLDRILPGKPGKEYLVYVPYAGKVTADLSGATGAMAVEWFSLSTGAL